MPYLQTTDIAKSFGAEPVLNRVSLSVERGEVLSVLGRSGSGKTTLLKIIAGLERADAGTVSLEGQPLDGTPPHRRNVVYLYQEALLFPHLNVFDNIAFGLRLRRVPRAEVRRLVEELLGELDLMEQANKMAHQLSGGQRQRVSFGRALIINPRVLLLDEPFGALDTETRTQMQELFKKIAARFDITALFVTHDLKEALIMGNRIGLMVRGTLKIYATKQDFVDDPATGVDREVNFWKSVGP